MAKYFEQKTIFHFKWDQVAQGYWMRYPNPESKHVLSEDTFYREVRDNKLFSKRLLTKTNKVPRWGERFIRNRDVKIVEESIVDPKTKTLTTYTRNIGYTTVMSIVEKVTYKVSDENSNWTVATRSAWIDSRIYGFSRPIKAFGLERFRKNCHKMVNGFNYVLSNMFPHSSGGELTSASIGSKERIKDAAKKASDLAKAKAKQYSPLQSQQT